WLLISNSTRVVPVFVPIPKTIVMAAARYLALPRSFLPGVYRASFAETFMIQDPPYLYATPTPGLPPPTSLCIRDPNSILVFFHFLSYLTCLPVGSPPHVPARFARLGGVRPEGHKSLIVLRCPLCSHPKKAKHSVGLNMQPDRRV